MHTSNHNPLLLDYPNSNKDQVDNLNEVEQQFYEDNREKYELGICDKYNTIEIRLIYPEYDFEFLSERGLKECEEKGYTALSEEAFEELTI